MKNLFQKVKTVFAARGFRKTLKIIGFFFLSFFSLLFISAIVLHIYFEKNKPEIVTEINTQINNNIVGEAKIGDLGYEFLTGFPNFSFVLSDVEIRDSLFVFHKRPILKAEKIELCISVLSLLKNEINIHKMVIKDATIDLFKDKNGISNSNIFKNKKNREKSESTTSTSIEEVDLKNVRFISENQMRNNLFHFEIESLKAKTDYTLQGWETAISLKTMVKSLAFNKSHGSFVKNKIIEGKMSVLYSEDKDQISIVTKDLGIGNEDFIIKANFNLGKINSLYNLDIRTKIKWRNAANLLSNNITAKLNEFNLKAPLLASCLINGDMNVKGDPQIIVNAEIKNDELTTFYGIVKNCSFKGKFTNDYKPGLGINDANSVIVFYDFKGELGDIPIRIPSGVISNLEKPIATGKFNSAFDVVKMKSLINDDFIKFSGGSAQVNLDFKFDIVNLRLNKPDFNGNIFVKNASLYYKPKNINLQKTNIDLEFTEQALLIKNLKYQNKNDVVYMEGRVDNFLNLYYDAPEKMIVNWKIHSPNLDVREVVRILSYQEKSRTVTKNVKKQSSNQLQNVFSKSQVNIDLLIDKMVYNRLNGNQFKVNIQVNNGGFYFRNGSVQSYDGGSLAFDAEMVFKNGLKLFKSNVNLKDANISDFLASFDNFGVTTFVPNNIKGKLSLTANLAGNLDSKDNVNKKSISGNLDFRIKDGALVNFKSIQKIGKTIFPNRNVSNITFRDLYGITTLNEGKIKVKDFKITSNVLNLDAKGIYSLSNTGTNLGLRIPLRNPKDDYKIADLKAREAARYKGIVINLTLVDGENGETKITLGKPSEDTD